MASKLAVAIPVKMEIWDHLNTREISKLFFIEEMREREGSGKKSSQNASMKFN